MMKGVVLRALVVSIAAWIVGSLATVGLFGRASVPLESYSYEQMATMPYGEAMEYRAAHTQELSGLRYTGWILSHGPGTAWLLKATAPQFPFYLLGCLFAGLWVRRAVQQDNATAETRKESAR
jgi:hypothetical protein